MAAFDLTAADPLMKIHFNPRIVKQFNTAAVLFNRLFEGKGIPISNRGLEIPIHVGPNADFTFYSDGGTLPAGAGQRLTRASVGFQSFALAVQFTGATLDAAGNDAVTYAKALTFNIKNATVDALKYLNIYSFGDGSGLLAKVGATASWAAANDGVDKDVSGTVEGNRYLRVGMNIEVHQGTTSTVRGTLTVTSVSLNPAGGTTIRAAVVSDTSLASVTSGDGIYVTGSYGKAIMGLDGIIDDGSVVGTFQGVARASFPEFNGNVISLSGSPALSRDHLRRAIAMIQIARGSVSMGALEIWSHPAQLHAYADMGWPLKRFQGGQKTFDAGYTAYEWEGIPWVIDTDCPKNKIFFVDSESLLKTTARALSFDDRTGAILRQIPSSTAGRYDDKFVAFLLARFNLGAYSPNSNTKIAGLGIPSGY